MVTIHIHNGKPRHSRNLRGILDYARRQPVRLVRMYLSAACVATVDIIYDDESYCTTTFADWRVLRGWVAARRSWTCEVIDRLPAA